MLAVIALTFIALTFSPCQCVLRNFIVCVRRACLAPLAALVLALHSGVSRAFLSFNTITCIVWLRGYVVSSDVEETLETFFLNTLTTDKMIYAIDKACIDTYMYVYHDVHIHIRLKALCLARPP
jgi:hypothetical protein